jgi:hypothetical protein
MKLMQVCVTLFVSDWFANLRKPKNAVLNDETKLIEGLVCRPLRPLASSLALFQPFTLSACLQFVRAFCSSGERVTQCAEALRDQASRQRWRSFVAAFDELGAFVSLSWFFRTVISVVVVVVVAIVIRGFYDYDLSIRL